MALPKSTKPMARSRIDLDQVETLGANAHEHHKQWKKSNPDKVQDIEHKRNQQILEDRRAATAAKGVSVVR